MEELKKIVIVDCTSTATNYMFDASQNKMQAILLDIPSVKNACPSNYLFPKYGDPEPICLEAKEKYEDTLAMIKQYNPVAVLPGSDNGLELSIRLSNDLHLPSPSYQDLPKMRDKGVCQKALKDYGIRSIESTLYENLDQALNFFKSHKNHIVVKPIKGTSSVGVAVCKTEQEVKNAINAIENDSSSMIAKNILLQEFIEGEEYVVNTVTCKGVTKITSAWHYFKKHIPGYSPVYMRLDFVSPTSKEIAPIAKYNFEVLKAIGMTHGISHNEFKVDDKGPVLIECNCRVPGGSMAAAYLDRVLGHHETNINLLSYINPDEFMKLPDIHEPISNGTVKFIVLDKDIYIKKDRFAELFDKLPSYVFHNFGLIYTIKDQWLKRTIDYHTAGGVIFLENKDYEQLMKDYGLICDYELNHLEKLYELGQPPK